MMSPLLLTIFQTIAVLLLAPFAVGFVRMVKARFQGRRGASPFLPYTTIATLLKKEMIISSNTSWVFRFVPFLCLGTTLVAAIALPIVTRGGIAAPLSDFILIGGLFALEAVALVLGGLDPGSAFGGMGSSRTMTMTAIMEPALIFAFAGLTLTVGSANIDAIIGASSVLTLNPAVLLAVIALIFVALAENARYPVDNPATHLELTMLHEAMILEYSGPYLAIIEYAGAIKLCLWSLLIANIVWPVGLINVGADALGLASAFGIAIVKIVVMMILLALLESTMAKMRFYRMHEYAAIAFVFAGASVLFALF